MSRVSLYPNQGLASNTNTQSTKQRQAMALQAKLAELSQHVEKLDEVLQVTAEQAGCIRELGAYHGALFMASQRILTETNTQGPPTQQK